MSTPFRFEVGQKFILGDVGYLHLTSKYHVGDTFEVVATRMVTSERFAYDQHGLCIAPYAVARGLATLIEDNKIMTEEKWQALLKEYNMSKDRDGDWHPGKGILIPRVFYVNSENTTANLKGLALAALYEIWKQEQQQKLDEIPF